MSDEQQNVAAQLYNEAASQDQKPVADEQAANIEDKTEEIEIEEGVKGNTPEGENSQEKTDSQEVKKEGETQKTEDNEKSEAPEKYELKTPEETMLSKEDVDGIAEFAKKQGLSNEKAQDLLNFQNETISKFVDRETQKLVERSNNEWVNEIKNDKEIGGESYSKNVELAKRVLQRFADKKLMEDLNATGYGNHPELVRTFVRIGKSMADDTLVINKTSKENIPMEELFYGSKN